MSSRGKRIIGYVLVCVLTMAIGFMISLQVKTTLITGSYAGGMVSLAQAQASTADLNKLKSEKEELLKELDEKEAKIQEYESRASEGSNEAIQQKLQETEKYKMAAGLTNVEGQGIVVDIDDPTDEPDTVKDSVITNNYELLLILVNKLREAGAEAISINGQRVTAYTEISLAGKNININGTATAPPYQVKAIGNSDTLESTLSIRYGIIYTMRNDYNLSVKIEQSDSIEIPRYTDVVSFKYAETVE